MVTNRSGTSKGHQIRRISVAGALGALLAVTAVGCGSSSDSDNAKKAASTTTTTTTTTTTVATATGGGTDGQTSGSDQASNGDGGSSGDGAAAGGGQAIGAPPTISSFSTPENIDCHNGNLQNFTAGWSTTDAVKVTISIDGPGIYETYGPNGDTSLPFNCSSSHTFLLTAHGPDGQSATQSVTLQPRNVQTQNDDDDDETTTTGP